MPVDKLLKTSTKKMVIFMTIATVDKYRWN